MSLNLANLLHKSARRWPTRPALMLGDETLATWSALSLTVAKLANSLKSRWNLADGDRVALFMHNDSAYMEIMFACWHAGLVVVPVNAKLHAKELAYTLQHCAPAIVFVSAGTTQVASEAMRENGESTIAVIDITSREFVALKHGEPIAVQVRPQASPAWLFYTSGTTGRPKGAVLTHQNLLAMSMSYFMDIDPPHSGGHLIHAAPMSHGSGLYMLPHVILGNAQVIPASHGFEAGEALDLINRLQAVSLFVAPTMLNRMTEQTLHTPTKVENLRAVIWGGAPLHLPDLKAAIGTFGYRLAQLYGQGETPMTIAGMTCEAVQLAHEQGDDEFLESSGYPHTVVDVETHDDAGLATAVGDTGEIVVRGETVMARYWQDTAATAETLRGGWLHTGDTGAFHARGFLMLKSRLKEVIISGGSNIYPREVEDVLLRHADVMEAAVIGVADKEWGERVVAFVVARPGTDVDTNALDQLTLENIARFKRPKEYCFIEALPKNNYGKIVRRDLVALYAQRTAK